MHMKVASTHGTVHQLPSAARSDVTWHRSCAPGGTCRAARRPDARRTAQRRRPRLPPASSCLRAHRHMRCRIRDDQARRRAKHELTTDSESEDACSWQKADAPSASSFAPAASSVPGRAEAADYDVNLEARAGGATMTATRRGRERTSLLLGHRRSFGIPDQRHAVRLHVLPERRRHRVQPPRDAREKAVHPPQVHFLRSRHDRICSGTCQSRGPRRENWPGFRRRRATGAEGCAPQPCIDHM